MSLSSAERIERLEQELADVKRGYRRVLTTVGAGAVAAVLLAWSWNGSLAPDGTERKDGAQEVVRAGEFVVEGDDGEVKARLGEAAGDGAGLLKLNDAQGNVRIGLGETEGGHVLHFYNKQSPSAQIALGLSDAGPLLLLADESGQRRVELSMTKSGAGLNVFDDAGEKRAALGSMKVGSGLVLWDGDGQSRAVIVSQTSGPTLRLSDKGGTSRLQLGVGTTTTSGGRRTTYPESSIRLFGPEGNLAWSAPR